MGMSFVWLLGLVVFPAVARAEDPVAAPSAPLLWKVEADGLATSYLFGTIHIPDRRVVNLPEVVTEALESVDAVYTELALDAVTSMKAMTRMMRKDERKLKEILPEDVYELLEEAVASRGMSLAVFERLELWGVGMMVSTLDILKMMDQGPPLDLFLYNKAKGEDKEVGGIETVDEQIDAIRSGTEAEQIDQLRHTLREMKEAEEKGTSMLEEMTRVYLVGDEVELMEMIEGMGDAEGGEELMNSMLTVRNLRMAERSAEKMKAHPERAYFFAYGAAHFPGAGGVVELLREQGFDVYRVDREGNRREDRAERPSPLEKAY